MHEPGMMRRYKQLQTASIFAALTHAVTALLIIYISREGRFDQFSIINLMHFVPQNLVVWRTTCIFVALSCFSFLFFALSVERVIARTDLTKIAIILIVIAIAIDLPSQGRMMVFFADVSSQLVFGGSFARQDLLIEGWKTINNCITNSLLIANFLYSVAGLALAYGIIRSQGIPSWIGWTSVPVWSAGVFATVFTFQGLVHWGLVTLLSCIIGFIVWSILVCVAIDSSTQKKPAAEPANS